MKNKVIIPTILFIAVLIFAIFILWKQGILNRSAENNQVPTEQNNQQDNQIIFFYGATCPHCLIVEKYMAENNILSKISIVQKEVYNNQANANDLVAKAKICNISTTSIGVPFLWTGEKCIEGDQNIISFLQLKAMQ